MTPLTYLCIDYCILLLHLLFANSETKAYASDPDPLKFNVNLWKVSGECYTESSYFKKAERTNNWI